MHFDGRPMPVSKADSVLQQQWATGNRRMHAGAPVPTSRLWLTALVLLADSRWPLKKAPPPLVAV